MKLPFNAGAKKELYALLMLALATDRPITLRFVDASQDCVVAYAFMERS